MARKQGVIFSYIYMIAEILSSMLFTPYMIRSLGKSEYGIFSLVANITGYLLLFDMGIGNAIVRYMAKYRANNDMENQKKFLGVSISFYSIIAIFVLIAGFTIQQNIEGFFNRGLSASELILAKKMFGVTMVNAALTLFSASFRQSLIAYEKFVLHKCIGIGIIALRVLISVILLNFGFGGMGIVSANLSVTVIGMFAYGAYVIFGLKIIPKFSSIEKSFVLEIFSYSAFIFIQMLATQLNSMTDQILIGALVASSSGVLAVYAVGSNISSYFQSLATSVNGVLMPGVVKMAEQNAKSEQYLDEMVKVGRIMFIMLGIIWTVFLVFGRNFVEIWAGEEYSNGYLAAVIIMLPLMFTLIQGIGTQILWALNKHKVQAYLKMGSTLINIILTIILIKVMNPLIGASIGTAVAYLLGDVIVMNIVFKKDIHISMITYYKRLFKGILPCLVIAGIAGFVFSFSGLGRVSEFLIGSSIMVIIYLAALFMFGVNNSEKQMLMSIVNKITGVIKRR